MARGQVTDIVGARRDLLRYCETDTLVMVRLHEVLAAMVGTERRVVAAGRQGGRADGVCPYRGRQSRPDAGAGRRHRPWAPDPGDPMVPST